jgi:erythromycin esterase
MVSLDDQTWNIRDRHMMDTLTRLLEFHGPSSKAIVWEHNTHVGDARYTDMARAGMINTGELARKQFAGSQTCLVGFASYKGTVIAGSAWGAPMQEMEMPEAKKGSLEEILHNRSEHNRYMIFDKNDDAEFSKTLGHRAIGVVYHPGQELHNYVPSIIAKRYDALVYINESRALHPLFLKPHLSEVPDTYPFNY